MLLKRKRSSIINWFNCIVIVDSPLESLQQLADGRHFKKLIGLIDPTTEEELSEDVDTYTFIEQFLNGYFHSEVGAFIDTAACSQGNEMELAKISILLLSAVVQNSLSKETDFLSSLTQLEDSVQEDIRDFMQVVMFPDGDKLSADFSLVLTKKKMQFSADTPLRQTPRRSTRRSSLLSPSSPLMTFIDSPMFVRQTTIRNLEAKVTSLMHQLHTEENRATEIEMENGNLKQSVKSKENEVQELRRRLNETHSFRDSAEESALASSEKYKAEIQSLTNQLKEHQNIHLELSRLQKENGELLNCNNNLHSRLEDYQMTKKELNRIATELKQAQTTTESQKDYIEKIQAEHINLTRALEERENEVKTVRSLYDDAMQEVRNLQNSPELPKGESMKVVVEMQVEELEKEIKHLKEREIELTDHLKTSARLNDSLKKDVEAAEEKCNQVEERLTNVVMLKEKELSERDSRIAIITDENHSLHEKLQNLHDELNQQTKIEEQKAEDHAAEIDRLKTQLRQDQVRLKESIVNLRTELSDMNDKLKICENREKESMTKMNQLLSQNDSLSLELEQRTKKLSEAESSLKTALECKDKEIYNLKSDVDVTKQHNHQLEKKLQDLHAEIDCLKRAAEQQSETHAAEMQHVVNQSKQVCAEYEENKGKIQEELSDLKSKIQYYCEKEEHDQKSLHQVVAERNALSHELELTKANLSENEGRLNIVLKDKEKGLSEYHSTVSALNKEIHSLEEKIQSLMAENNQLKVAEEQTSKTHSSEVKRITEVFNQQLEDHKDKQAKLNAQLSDANAKLKLYLEMEGKQVDDDVCDGLRGALEKLVIENDKLQKYHGELAKKLESAEQSSVVLAAQKREKDKEAENLSKQVQDLQNTLNQQDKEHKKDVREMQGILESLKEKAKSSEAQLLVVIENKASDLKRAENSLKEATAANAELTNEICQLKLDKSKLEENLVMLDAAKKEKDEIGQNLLRQVGEYQSLLDQRNQFYEKEVKEMQDLIKSLKQENKSVKEVNCSLEEKGISVEKELQKAKEMIESKGIQLAKVEGCLKESRTLYSELGSEMQQLKLEKSKLEEQLDEKNRLHMYSFDSEKHALENKLEEAKQHVNTLMDESKKKDETIDLLSKRLKMLEEAQAHNDVNYKAEIKKFKDLLHNSQEENEVLKSEHSTLVQNLYSQIEEKGKGLENITKEIQELKEASRKKESEFRAIEETLKAAETTKSKLLNEMSRENSIAIESLQADLEKVKEDNRGLQLLVKNCESEKSTILQQIKDRDQSIAILTEKKQKQDEDVCELSRQVENLQRAQEQMAINHELEIKNIQDLLQKSLQEKKELESNHAVMVQNLNRCIEDKTTHLEKLHAEVQELKDLKSQKNNEVESVQKSVKELETLNASLRDELTSLQTEASRRTADFESEIKRLSLHYQERENEINNRKKVVENENEDLKNEIIFKDKKVNETLTMLKSVTESKESDINGLKEEIKNLKELFEKVTLERNDLQKCAKMLDALKQDAESKDSEINRQKEEIKSLNELLEKVTLERNDLQKRTEMLDASKQDLMGKVQDSENKEREVSGLKEDIKNLKGLLEKVTLERNDLQKCVKMLDALKQDTESKECDINRLKEEIKSLKELLEKVSLERNDLQKCAEVLDASKQDLMEKLQDTERRHDNLMKQKEIAESDFSRCVEKRDEDIEKLNKQIQELQVRSAQQGNKSPESKLSMEVQNLNQSVQQKEKEIERSLKKIQELDAINKQKDDSLKKIKYSMEEVETARRKLLTEISCLNEEKQIDKEKIDKLTSECKRLTSYSQQQKKMIDEMKELQLKLLDSDKENKVVQQKYLEHKKKNDQRVEVLKKTIVKLEREKEELEKCLLSLKQKVIGYQNVSESCKQAVAEERKRWKAVKKELEESEKLRDRLTKQINGLEQSIINYKQQKSCLEGELQRTRSELNVLKTKYDQDFHKPVSRRFSSPISPFVSLSRGTDSSMADSQFLSPCAWRKPAVKKRVSNASSLASTVSTSSETVNNMSTLTPIKADEEDFLNYSSIAELKSGPASVTKSSKKRLSELQRRNTLCLPHMQSSYPVETQMRPVCEFTDEVIKTGFVAIDESQGKKVSGELRPNASKAVHQNANGIVHERDNKGVSPKRKRTNSEDSGSRHVKVKKSSAASSDKGW